MPDSPFKESIKHKSVKPCLYMLCVVLSASICDKDYFGNKVMRDCRIAVSNRSYDRLKTNRRNIHG